MSDCIFCKIIAKEIPSLCLYEDEDVFAFSDINPQAPVHFLVVPKEHIASMDEVNENTAAVAAKCLTAIPKVAKKAGLTGGYRVISNCGDDAGQTVHHLHFHVLGGKSMGEKLL